MDTSLLKEKICKVIDENRESIIQIGRKIYANPELGYKESFASDLVAKELASLGLDAERGLAVTGVKASLQGKSSGPALTIMGELDAVICREHPDADPSTGAVHACGHNYQVGAMMGAAFGLVLSGAASEISGRIDFFGVPAEEYVELEFRSGLKNQGKIRFFGGKQELIAKGYFDTVNIVMMIHSLDLGPMKKKILTGPTGNGFLGKTVVFTGREAHAGAAPHEGINALNAAVLAMNNIHAQRETFQDEDKIRVHPIITKGGDIVNVVPAEVTMESYVRGRTTDGILDANRKVNRAVKAGAMAVGADVKITDIPGYLPLLRSEPLDALFQENAARFVSLEEIQSGAVFAGSFDIGDVSHIIPVLHPLIGGVSGKIHTREFRAQDEELAYIIPAKAMAMTAVDLLTGDADKAKSVVSSFTPKMTKESYLAFMESVSKTITFSGAGE
jgi:amidohydrolase